MGVPISIRLKNPDFANLAELQDLFMDTLYAMDNGAVLHGGTGIWRCYSGNRFSYDIDAYITSEKKISEIKQNIAAKMGMLGVYTEKVLSTNLSLRMYLRNSTSKLSVDLKCIQKDVHAVLREYDRANGTTMKVRTLTPEQYILEKIAAYESRKYARDLYDIYQLLDYVTNKIQVRKSLKEFLAGVEKPANEDVLSEIVYAGPVPSFSEMIDSISKATK